MDELTITATREGQTATTVPAPLDTSTPVVVIKLFHHLSLGLVRSLGRWGVRIYGIDPIPSAPSLHSRYCTQRFIWDVDAAPAEATVDYLLELGKKLGRRAVLFHTADETAEVLADYADILSERYIFSRQSPSLVRSLASKKEMYFLAKKNDIPTAETLFPASRADVMKYLNNGAVFPIMLKGIDGRILELRTGKKMTIVRGPDELLAMYDRMEDPEHPNLMLQEYIPGGDDTVWMFNGYFNSDSDCLFAITGKKIRQAPVYTGYTSLGICLRNDGVEEVTKRFMKQIGYRGILDIGYRYDARDRRYKVLDINPRIGATFRLFVATNGMDVARAAYLDLTGQTVPPSTIAEGRKWFVEDRDIVSSIRYFRDRNLTLGGWLKSFRGVREAAWFAPDDPLPFFMMIGKFAVRLLRRILPGSSPKKSARIHARA